MQNYKLNKCVYGYKPLYCNGDRVILAKGYRLFSASLDLEHIEFICELPNNVYSGRIRLLERILRGGIQALTLIGDDALLAVCKSSIWRVSLKDGTFVLDFEIPDNRKLLNFSSINDVDGFENCICFGEYFNNPDMAGVRIWTRSLAFDSAWKVAHTFENGQINHIHNIIPDKQLGAAWILTGDFDQAASIWLAGSQFGTVENVKRGDQLYRAVWMRHMKNSEYCYATDSQLSINKLNRLIYADGSTQVEQLMEIEGSSIYFGTAKDHTVFSTAVEPGESSRGALMKIIETTPGPGIKSKYACIYTLDAAYNIREIFRGEKDKWPMRLAQFGTFMFPCGVMPHGYLYAYGLAVKKFDNVCMVFKADT